MVVLFNKFGAMAPIMALKPVIRANAKTEPDQTCFCVVVGEKSENQSVSHIIIIAYLTRERERRERIHGIRC